MTDHLADARACIQAAAQAPHPDTRISWLTVICEQIIAHLEAQQASPQPETDPACRERWPECRQGGYDPACCRFPKSCSCDAPPQPATAPPAALRARANRIEQGGQP